MLFKRPPTTFDISAEHLDLEADLWGPVLGPDAAEALTPADGADASAVEVYHRGAALRAVLTRLRAPAGAWAFVSPRVAALRAVLTRLRAPAGARAFVSPRVAALRAVLTRLRAPAGTRAFVSPRVAALSALAAAVLSVVLALASPFDFGLER